jgi:sugar/nucleoside kinase (ribokinase family)
VPTDQTDAVVAGHICLDMIPALESGIASLDALLTPGRLNVVGPLTVATGGAVPNTGLALHRLGVSTRLMGKVADDMVGRAILDVLRAHDPALAEGMILAEGRQSSYTVVINPPGLDRMFLHCPGANDTFGADDVGYDKLSGARVFHFGYPPVMRRMYADSGRELRDLLRQVKQLGPTTSLDMARPDPASEAGRADWRAILKRALPHVDVILPSFEETLFMLDRAELNRMEETRGGDELSTRADGALLRSLSDELIRMGAAMVGLKLGTQGLYLRTADDPSRLASIGRCAPKDTAIWVDRELLAPCFRVEVAGTTGSGDCTIAGFLAALLRSLTPEHVMIAAVAVGACNVEKADATSGVPTWEVVQERIRAGWPSRPVAISLPGWRWDEQAGVWRGPNDRGRS